MAQAQHAAQGETVYNILRKKDGCDWEGELRHLEHHQMEECGWALVKCCYECGVCVPRPQLVEHELHLCPKRPVDVQCEMEMLKQENAKSKQMFHGMSQTQTFGNCTPTFEKPPEQPQPKVMKLEEEQTNTHPFAELLLRGVERSDIQESQILLPYSLSRSLGLSSQKLYIREVYRTFEEKIGSLDSRRPVVITGTPGIGKSCFGFYLFIKAIRSKQVVALHIYDETYVFLQEKVLYGEKAKQHLSGCEKSILYLYDCGKHDIAPIHPNLCKLVVFTSPDIEKYKDMLKRRNPAVYYMPLWTKEELQHVPTSLDQTVVEERYARYGGVPCYVFREDVEDIEEILLRAIHDFPIALNELRKGVFCQASNMLLHLIPNDEFKAYTLCYASKYVEERVDHALRGSTRQAAIEYLKAVLEGDIVKSLGPFNGQLFEKIVHRKFVDEGCVQFKKVRELKAHDSVTTTKFSQLHHNGVKFFDNCSTVNGEWKGYYCQPLNKNNPSFDSFLVCKNTIYVFQMTIQSRHDLKATGLTMLTTFPLIKELLDQQPRLKIKFYFVVPLDRFFLYKTRVSIEGQFEYQDKLEQFVAQIDL